MERGFKARCESISVGLRRELGFAPIAPLSPYSLSEYLEVPVIPLTDMTGLETVDVRQLIEVDPDAWSALTVSNNGRDLIILNPVHTGGRPPSDIMHELGHLLLGHDASTMHYVGDEGIALRGYNAPNEEEASWLAGVLLLPRPALVHIRTSKMSNMDAINEYRVSQAMLTYRTRMAGIDN